MLHGIPPEFQPKRVELTRLGENFLKILARVDLGFLLSRAGEVRGLRFAPSKPTTSAWWYSYLSEYMSDRQLG